MNSSIHATHCCKKHGCEQSYENCQCKSCLWEREEGSPFCTLFRRIESITNDIPTNFLHLQEEVGELATEILIEQDQSYKKTEEGILAEAVDIAVCVMAIVANKTNDINHFYTLMDKKISKWEKNRK